MYMNYILITVRNFPEVKGSTVPMWMFGKGAKIQKVSSLRPLHF